jgi:hypothetical protein
MCSGFIQPLDIVIEILTKSDFEPAEERINRITYF